VKPPAKMMLQEATDWPVVTSSRHLINDCSKFTGQTAAAAELLMLVCCIAPAVTFGSNRMYYNSQ